MNWYLSRNCQIHLTFKKKFFFILFSFQASSFDPIMSRSTFKIQIGLNVDGDQYSKIFIQTMRLGEVLCKASVVY